MTNDPKANKASREAAAAQAALDAAEKNKVLVAQINEARAAILFKATQYGEESATGAMSQTKLAFLFNQACREGYMTVADAGKVYMAYAEGYNAAQREKGTLEVANHRLSTVEAALVETAEAGKSKSDHKTAISIFATFGRPAVVAEGLAYFDRVRQLRDTITAENRAQSSMFNAWVAVNRAVSKAADDSDLSDADVAAGKFEVTDAVILGALEKDEKKSGGKSDADKLDRLIADCLKLAKSDKYTGELKQALELLRATKVVTAETEKAATALKLVA